MVLLICSILILYQLTNHSHIHKYKISEDKTNKAFINEHSDIIVNDKFWYVDGNKHFKDYIQSEELNKSFLIS